VTNALLISATAATLAGLAGSGHCLAMCGGMAGALGMRAGQSTSGTRRLYNAFLYHVGRLSGYASAGALCGLLGSSTRLLAQDSGWIGTLRIASGVLMLSIAARVALRWNLLSGLERLGARFWMLLRPLAARQAARSSITSSLVLGFLWGWLPCGLVYSMLLFAAMSQSAALGAAILFAYGVGTLPSMFGASLFAGELQHVLHRPSWRFGAAVVLTIFGLWTIVTASASSQWPMLFCSTP
jgi:sulfite exporter TauE/SafE